MDDTEAKDNNPQSDTKSEAETVPADVEGRRVEVTHEEVKEYASNEDGPKPDPGNHAQTGGEVTEEKKEEPEKPEEELPPMDSRAAATCKYRWAKTVPTSSSEVIFFSSHKPNEPIVLSWNEAHAVFYSMEMQVSSGDYRGNVVVEGSTFPVEEHNVRPYTFEIDLYIKDDIIEDEVRANGAQLVEEKFQEKFQVKDVDTYRDLNTDLAGLPNMEGNGESSIHLTSKYEDLIRQQLLHKDTLDTSLDNEVNMSQKAELSNSLNGSARHTPIGDVAVESFRDNNDEVLSNPGSIHGLVNGSVTGSVHGSIHGSIHGSDHGSLHGSVHGSTHGSIHGSDHGSLHGSTHGSTHGSVHGSTHGSVHGSTHGSAHGSTHGSARQSPQWDLTDAGRSNILDELDMASHKSHHSSARQTPQSSTVEDILRNAYPRPSSRPGSELSGSYHSSGRHTPVATDVLNGDGHQSGARPGSQSLEGSLRQTPVETINRPSSAQGPLHGSTSHMPVTEAVDDILERYSRGSNRDKTESIDDVIESPPMSVHSSVRHTPQRELVKEDLSLPGSQRQMPQKEVITDSFRSSHERLYGSQEFQKVTYEVSNRPGSASGSLRSGSSRPHSVTSEQELSQYLDYQRGELGPRRAASLTGLHQSDPLLPPISQERPGSTSSMPPISSQSLDRHITTQENHIRVPAGGGSPQIRSPLVMTRSGSLSRASSRTVTPASGIGVPTENGFREDGKRIQDYEDTIGNLRKLLSSRETEVHQLTDQVRDLKDINRSLREELEHSRANSGHSGRSSREFEKQYEHLKSEKDILASEVVKLRDQLSALSGKSVDSISIGNYSPNNPMALQRKIADLEGHIQDMQEANETAMSHLTKSEKQVKELVQENESLRKRQSHSLQDLEDDNRRLQDKISLLEDGGPSDYRYRIEVQQLKDDLRALRDRNYQLNEENIRLKEGSDTRQGLPPAQSAYSHDLKITRETTLKTDDPPRRLSSRQTTPEQSPLTRRNISSLERSYGSDRDSKEYKYTFSQRLDRGYLDNYKLEKQSPSGLERSRSDQERTSRSVPDGEVSEKLVTDSGRYSRRSYEHSRSERDPMPRDTTMRDIYSSDCTKDATMRDIYSSDRTKDTTMRDIYSSDRTKDREQRGRIYESHRTTGSNLDSRVIYKMVRERMQSPRMTSSSRPRHSSSPSNLGRVPPQGVSAADPRGGFLTPSLARGEGPIESRYRPSSYYSDINEPAAGNAGRSSDIEPQPRKRHSSYDRSYKDYDMPRKSYPDENGDLSDTATDILLSSDVIDRKPGRSRRHRRRQSVESVDSVSSLSDEDHIGGSHRRRRSKSVDARGDWVGRRTPTGSTSRTTPASMSQMRTASSTERLQPTLQGSAGFRSVMPEALLTQHNKGMMGNVGHALSSSLTQGMRPFAPRSPGDMKPEDVVKFSRQGGKLSQGMVKFIGHLPGRSDVYLGVELDKEEGKHDGTFEGIRYFKCKANKGVFVAFNKVVMAWAP